MSRAQSIKDLKIWLRALKADEYLVNLLPSGDRTGRHKPFTKGSDEIIESRDAFYRGNTVGVRDVYARPLSTHYVLVDDVMPEYLPTCYEYNCTLVVESSAKNYQVWFKDTGIETEQQQKAIAQWFADLLDGDAGATGPRQLARLPGFHNRKTKPHRNKFLVRLHRDRRYIPGQFSSIPDEAFEFTGRKRRRVHADANDADDESTQTQSQGPRQTRNGGSSVAGMTSVQRDNSSADWHYTMSLLEEHVGHISDAELMRKLEEHSQKEERRTVNYIRNTVQRAREAYEHKNPFWRAFG